MFPENMIESVNVFYAAIFAAGAYLAYAIFKPKEEPIADFKLKTMK